MSLFHRHIGIDYSGAEGPTASLKGLRVYSASNTDTPKEVLPPPSFKKYWTRRGTAEWLVKILKESAPTIVGIDHGFSFPAKYFERHGLSHEWDVFLEDFCKHWPTDEDHTYVQFIRDGVCGNGKARQGDRRWRRLTEHRAGAAKSVFFFDVQGSVAKSTHAGIPWLRYVRKELGAEVHFWPFDGWIPRPNVHVITEVYPTLWRHLYPVEERTRDQQDAYAVCRWLQETDQSGNLRGFFSPSLSSAEQPIAEIEGWILGVA